MLRRRRSGTPAQGNGSTAQAGRPACLAARAGCSVYQRRLRRDAAGPGIHADVGVVCESPAHPVCPRGARTGGGVLVRLPANGRQPSALLGQDPMGRRFPPGRDAAAAYRSSASCRHAGCVIDLASKSAPGECCSPKSPSLRQAAGSSPCRGTGTRTPLTSGTSGTGNNSETSAWTNQHLRGNAGSSAEATGKEGRAFPDEPGGSAQSEPH